MVEPLLREAGQVCGDVIGGPVDLVGRVRRREETSLESYPDAIALIVAMELAQIRLLQKFFGIDYAQGRMAYGYSLGEIAALVAGGTMAMGPALRVPLAVSEDCVELARRDARRALLAWAEPGHRRHRAALPEDQSSGAWRDRRLVVSFAQLAAADRSGRHA